MARPRSTTRLANELGKKHPDWQAVSEARKAGGCGTKRQMPTRKRRCAACGLLESKDKAGSCIECHARTLSDPTRYLSPFEAEMLEMHVGAKTCPQFARYMAIRHGIYRTQGGWRRAAHKRNLKFLTHQPAMPACELAGLLGVDAKYVVKRIQRGEILSLGRGGGRSHLIPYEEAERVLAQAPTACPFDDPLSIDEAATLMGYNRSYFVWLMNSPAAGLDPWLGPDRFKRVSRTKVLALKERMLTEGLTARDVMDPDRVKRLRDRSKHHAKLTRDRQRTRRHAI